MPEDGRENTGPKVGEVVLDVTDFRFLKVVMTWKEYKVEKVNPGRYLVRKGDKVYLVGIDKAKPLLASCDCPDWNFNARKLMLPCKHIWLAAEAEGLVSFPTEKKD